MVHEKKIDARMNANRYALHGLQCKDELHKINVSIL